MLEVKLAVVLESSMIVHYVKEKVGEFGDVVIFFGDLVFLDRGLDHDDQSEELNNSGSPDTHL